MFSFKKLKKYLFGITIIKDQGVTLEQWMIEQSEQRGGFSYNPFIISDSGASLLYYKHGLRQNESYKIKVMFFNFLFYKNKLVFRRIIQTHKEGRFVIYQSKNKKKHKTVWLCEKELKNKIGFVPTKIFYKITNQ